MSLQDALVDSTQKLACIKPCLPVLRIRIRRLCMFLGLQDPDPLIRGTDPDPSISSKNSFKNFIPTDLWLLYDFLSLKNYVNVASKSKKQTF
jgi:hypothetical protein